MKSSIIEASNVFLAILAATLIFKLEKLTPAKIAGCILGFAGVVIINLNGGSLDTSMSFSGEGCILLSAAAYALSSILIKRYAQKDEPVTLSGYQFLFGGVILSLIGLAAGGRVRLYIRFHCSAALSVPGFRNCLLPLGNPAEIQSSGKGSCLWLYESVFGVILSAILLGESNQAFTLTGLAALALVCAGIYIVNRHQMKPV